MKHTIHPLADGTYHQFQTEKGVVLVRVEDLGDGDARLSAYERESAKASIDLPNRISRELPQMKAMRNHFGTGMMLRILRAVVKASPDVKRWITDNRTKTSTNHGREHVRTF